MAVDAMRAARMVMMSSIFVQRADVVPPYDSKHRQHSYQNRHHKSSVALPDL